jgi:hypothetical protein
MDIKKYLSDGGEPLTMAEFNDFWKSLSEEEKQEFKDTKLPESKE